MVWKIVGNLLEICWNYHRNLLEVNFQSFGHFHGMESYKFVGIIIEIC